MSDKLILAISIIVYVIGVLIAFFVLCYRDAKRNKYTHKYAKEIEPEDFMCSILWPFALVIITVTLPFKWIRNYAVHMKEVMNPEKLDLNKTNG